MAGRVENGQTEVVIEVNGVAALDEAIDLNGPGNDRMEVRHRALTRLQVDIFDPCPLIEMSNITLEAIRPVREGFNKARKVRLVGNFRRLT